MPWLQLLTSKTIDVGGKPKPYRPGAWVEIANKTTAALWVAQGEARYATPLTSKIDLPGCGAVIIGSGQGAEQLRVALQTIDGLDITTRASPVLAFSRTLLIWPGVTFRSPLIPVGFNQLDQWQAACPFCEYDTLANTIGTVEARQRTQDVIRELRVMVYDHRLLFVRRDEMTQSLLDTWAMENETGDDSRLCFLRAVYQVKPMILPLPYTWLIPHGRDKYED